VDLSDLVEEVKDGVDGADFGEIVQARRGDKKDLERDMWRHDDNFGERSSWEVDRETFKDEFLYKEKLAQMDEEPGITDIFENEGKSTTPLLYEDLINPQKWRRD
jgi:hypothetical protein